MNKVLLLCYDDYANLMHDHARALRACGVDTLDIKLKRHAFGYAEEAQVADFATMERAISEADVIVIYHSHLHVLEFVKNFVNKLHQTRAVIGFHTGSIWREDPVNIRRAFEAAGVRRHLTDQCEFLMHPAGGDLIYQAAAIDVRAIRAHGAFPAVGYPYFIAHYPSKADVKGTETIQRIVQQHAGDHLRFHLSTDRVPHPQQLRRMSECDIYIELFQPQLGGQPYGCFGVTAFEAATLGRVVLTQNIHEQAYIRAYGVRAPFLLINTEQQFAEQLGVLSSMSPGFIRQLQEDTYRWVLTHHGLEATGHRLANILLSQ